MKKQDIIFQMLKAHSDQHGVVNTYGALEILPTVTDSCALPKTPISPGQTTCTSVRARFVCSTSRPATR